MNRTSFITGEEIHPNELAFHCNTKPAAKALYSLKRQGVKLSILLDEAIVYYERVSEQQQKTIACYVERFGILPETPTTNGEKTKS